jgi:hypothetical protein
MIEHFLNCSYQHNETIPELLYLRKHSIRTTIQIIHSYNFVTSFKNRNKQSIAASPDENAKPCTIFDTSQRPLMLFWLD